MPTPFPGLTTIGQIAINAHDVERATAFYRDVLGLRFLFAAPGLAFFDCSGVRLMLSKAEKPEFDHPASILYYKVDDLEAACTALAERGVAIESAPHLIARMPDHELWMAFVRDSEANLLGLMCEKRSQPS
ncbi:MAG TPA: VOC family protein [Thermoanaerobaculia bacterium]